MSAKRELVKEIQMLEAEMKELESKRSRSMAALLDTVISKETPDPMEVQFFRQYNAEIEVKRDKISDAVAKLKQLV